MCVSTSPVTHRIPQLTLIYAAHHRLPRPNRTLHSHPRPPASRPHAHVQHEHLPRERVSPRVAIHGGLGKVLQWSAECDELYGRARGTVRQRDEQDGSGEEGDDGSKAEEGR